MHYATIVERWALRQRLSLDQQGKGMKPTSSEKKRLREHWHWMPLRFRADGTVEAKKGDTWGLLLTACQLEETLRLWRSQ